MIRLKQLQYLSLNKFVQFGVLIILTLTISACEPRIPIGHNEKALEINLSDLDFVEVININEDYVELSIEDFERTSVLNFSRKVIADAMETNAHLDEFGFPSPTFVMRIELSHPDYETILIVIYLKEESLFSTTYYHSVTYLQDGEVFQFIYVSDLNDEIKDFLHK